ncbi:MAG: hypothetical protein U0930_23135 [Pirellulales bacterium]
MSENKQSKAGSYLLLGMLLMAGVAPSVGCQVSVAGQTLPSPYYLKDDVQYFPAGPLNKLANETAAIEKARAESIKKTR